MIFLFGFFLLEVGKDVYVAPGDTVSSIIAIGGKVEVRGMVDGDILAIGKGVRVSGYVDGDITSIGGPVYLESTAVVNGDVVVVGSTCSREEGARVGGEIILRKRHHHHLTFLPFRGFFSFISILILSLLTYLLFPGACERVEEKIKEKPGISFLTGLGAEAVFVPLFIMFVFTIIGIPIALLLFPAYFGAYILGITSFSLFAGKKILKHGNPYTTILLGFFVIHILPFLSFIPLIGAFFSFAGIFIAWATGTLGFGGVVLLIFEKGKRKEEK
ncbi:hypothetical protein DRQ18_07870 [bacterium]|nr:MAG: hypothetical protein DRQ18_07870 [bacterium]